MKRELFLYLAVIFLFLQSGFAQQQRQSQLITAAQAEADVLALYEGAKIVKTKLEHNRRNGSSHFEIKVLTADEVYIEVKINAANGNFSPPGRQRQTDLVRLTPAQARSKALALFPNGAIVKTELEYERNSLMYEIKITTAERRSAEVKIDAVTGDIVKIKRN